MEKSSVMDVVLWQTSTAKLDKAITTMKPLNR